MASPVIIRDNRSLFARYDELGPGDVVIGRVRLKPGEEHVLLDLTSRGVVLIPSASAQLCSRSKVFQARILGEFMVPGTRAVYDLHGLMELVSDYGRLKVGQVVCKLDRANGGQGILLFPSIEDVYNQAVCKALAFPFVIQPFVAGATDIRVVLLDEHVEAYRRHNPHNFRHNLHCGGKRRPWPLTPAQFGLCEQVMARAGFVYGCVDLLFKDEDNIFLSEINLRGGLRGARIDQREYAAAVEQLHEQLLDRQRTRTSRVSC